MAYAIGFQCTACGLCSSTCPNGAIRGFHRQYYIEPLFCTECALYAASPACVDVCPNNAIVEDQLRPGQRWTDHVPLRATHPALRKIRLNP
ncbi:MAG: 4Fe-4S binding protein [Bryobacterales bacterium]|nr:4Fe-4S binding protein [Bryobacterales bacterium]